MRILRGFSEGLTIAELERTTHVSARTIRATYKTLRERLPVAIAIDPDIFGGAGRVLAMDDSNSLLEAVLGSAHFRRHRKRHAPRMKREDEERLLATELLVRLLCGIDLRGLDIAAAENHVLIVDGFIKGLVRLRPRERVQTLAEHLPGTKPHAYPGLRLYEDYRRYLLKIPLGTQCLQRAPEAPDCGDPRTESRGG